MARRKPIEQIRRERSDTVLWVVEQRDAGRTQADIARQMGKSRERARQHEAVGRRILAAVKPTE